MSAGYYTQQELCDAIYSIVRNAKKPLSRREISAGIGRNKSPHVIRMIEHLTSTGYFVRSVDWTKFGKEVLVYQATSGDAPPCEAEV